MFAKAIAANQVVNRYYAVSVLRDIMDNFGLVYQKYNIKPTWLGNQIKLAMHG